MHSTRTLPSVVVVCMYGGIIVEDSGRGHFEVLPAYSMLQPAYYKTDHVVQQWRPLSTPSHLNKNCDI
jgi:hypothetical protein